MRGNRVLVSMLAPAVTLQLAVVYLPGLGSVFVTVPLPAGTQLAALAVAVGLLAVMEAEKALRRRGRSADQRTRAGT